MKKIILASGSPRRRELLSALGFEFIVDTLNDFEEKYSPTEVLTEVPAMMSRGKSHGFHRPLADDEVLITADTMVILDNIIMGKPHSRGEAHKMLCLLSGRTHQVLTAVTIRDAAREETFTETTHVTFSDLSDDVISYYIDNYKPYDKAGAYGIQEWIGYAGISGIEGSYFNVVGFPTQKVYEVLKRFL